MAALAHKAGWQVNVLAVGAPDALTGDAASAYAMASDVTVQQGVLLDGVAWHRLNGEVREPYRSAIDAINASGLPVAAVDVPSGLSADTGQSLGVSVRANLTVTFIGLKTGLLTGEAADQVGELVFDDLQADPALVAQTPTSAKRLDTHNLPSLAARPRTAHKGMFGRVLVIGGDHGFGGAALLSAESALRSGAGMLTLATRAEHIQAALTRMPEVMSAAIRSANQLMALIEPASVLVVGPGLGQASWGRSLLSAAANADRPQVWDADALNMLAAGR